MRGADDGKIATETCFDFLVEMVAVSLAECQKTRSEAYAW